MDSNRFPEEVYPGIWRITVTLGGFLKTVNIYVVGNERDFMLVDCGIDTQECWNEFRSQLDKCNVPFDQIHTVVSTHAHMDHYGLAGRLRQESDAEICLHPNEVRFMEHRFGQADKYSQQRITWLIHHGAPPTEAAAWQEQLEERRSKTQVVLPDRTLSEGEELRAGKFSFRVMWTEGHSPGHISLFDHERGILLVGDHVLEGVHPNVSMQPYESNNPLPRYLDSLTHFSRLQVNLALPGHGDTLKNIGERALELVQHQLDRRKLLLTLVSSQPRSAYELSTKVWADSVPYNWSQFNSFLRQNAVSTCATHLELLADEGLIKRSEDDQITFTSKE